MNVNKIAANITRQLLSAEPQGLPKSVKQWYKIFVKEGNEEKLALKLAIQRAYEEDAITEKQADALERKHKVAVRNVIREVPEKFLPERLKGRKVMVGLKSNKLIMKIDSESWTYPNEWDKWHNRFKRMLQTPMGSPDKEVDAWIKKNFGVEKPAKKS